MGYEMGDTRVDEQDAEKLLQIRELGTEEMAVTKLLVSGQGVVWHVR